MDEVGYPGMYFVMAFAVLGLVPYLAGIWAIVMLVQISRANREIAARLAAIESGLRQK